MPVVINGKKYYRTIEACKEANISRATMFRWLKSGVFKDVNYRDRRGWRLFSEEDVKRLKKESTRIKVEPIQHDLKFGKG